MVSIAVRLSALLSAASVAGSFGAALRAAAAPHGPDYAFVQFMKASRAAGEYNFDQFTKEYGRAYVAGTKEYTYRASLFQESLAEIRAVNTRNAKLMRHWRADVHPFMDWTAAERKVLNSGYKPLHRKAGIADLQTSASASHRSSLNASWDESFYYSNDNEPAGHEAVGPPMRDQGRCGSCWAISAVEAAEAQLIRQGAASKGDVPRLSAQALVDCVPNPQHCGGDGGCDGATGELAYDFMKNQGIPLESDLPYTAETGSCTLPSKGGTWPSNIQRVRISGFMQLPSNQADPLRQALVEQGPVVVSVDGEAWFNYGGGVFDGCSKDAVLGHAVLATGYGEDAGQKYWRIQNSWGRGWGENGHIRLLRHDNANDWCGIDHEPQKGNGCDGGPSQIAVCGMCGVLYDALVPQGVRIESASDSTSVGTETPAMTVTSADQGQGNKVLPVTDGVNAVQQMEKVLHMEASEGHVQNDKSETQAGDISTRATRSERDMDSLIEKLGPQA